MISEARTVGIFRDGARIVFEKYLPGWIFSTSNGAP